MEASICSKTKQEAGICESSVRSRAPATTVLHHFTPTILSTVTRYAEAQSTATANSMDRLLIFIVIVAVALSLLAPHDCLQLPAPNKKPTVGKPRALLHFEFLYSPPDPSSYYYYSIPPPAALPPSGGIADAPSAPPGMTDRPPYCVYPPNFPSEPSPPTPAEPPPPLVGPNPPAPQTVTIPSPPLIIFPPNPPTMFVPPPPPPPPETETIPNPPPMINLPPPQSTPTSPPASQLNPSPPLLIFPPNPPPPPPADLTPTAPETPNRWPINLRPPTSTPTTNPPPSIFAPGPPIFLPPQVLPPPLARAPPPPPAQAGTTPGRASYWCVAKPTVPAAVVQVAMDYACGSGADCNSIQPSGPCFRPDTLLAHASYAFNSYWQRAKAAGATCDFGGTAILITKDPSYDGCHYNLL